MRLRFTKMHGIGNDYVYVDAFAHPLADPAAVARRVAPRRTAIGSDGLILIAPSETADVRMEMYNADGSRGAMCGNGIRCVAKYAWDHGLARRNPMRVETDSGVKTVDLRLERDLVASVAVDMGPPIFGLTDVPFDAAGLQPQSFGDWQQWPLDLSGTPVLLAVLSMGNPHAVQLVDEVDTAPVAQQGPLIEHHARFTRRVNAGFLQVLDRRRVRLRVFERGAGETLACGSGACAAVVAGIRLGLLDRSVDVQTRGGLLSISWASDAAHVLMTGPATTVFQGEIDIPELL